MSTIVEGASSAMARSETKPDTADVVEAVAGAAEAASRQRTTGLRAAVNETTKATPSHHTPLSGHHGQGARSGLGAAVDEAMRPEQQRTG